MVAASAIVLFAHGAKDPEWARPMQRIQAAVRQLLPGTPVALAYLERMEPTLGEAVSQVVASGAKRISVVPLFLAAGGHIKEDLPALISQLRARHPAVAFSATAPIGEDDELLQAIAEWVVRRHQC
jgi:sirohydrochlorin cobaltochelatase